MATIGTLELVVAGLTLLAIYLYHSLTRTWSHWEKLGVKGPKPVLLFGNFKDVVFGKQHFALLIHEICREFKSEPVIGVFGRASPMLIVREPELIRDVLIKDFNVFPDRGFTSNISPSDPLNQNLLNLEHARWRPLRSKLTAVFSSARLRDMFYLMAECGQHFESYLEHRLLEANDELTIECRELTAKYTTDSIGVCAFGLNMNALGDENSGFRKFGRSFMASSFTNILRAMCRDWFPRIYRMLQPFIYNRAADFFIHSIGATVDFRKKNADARRNDFVDLLMDLRDQPDKLSDFEFTHHMLTSQAFLFFLAGFETSSTTMSNALYELALNQAIQDKLREEIRSVLSRDSGKLTYENVKEMKYLDKIFKETMRKYPPGSTLHRSSVAPYTFAGTNITIPKNTKVVVPVWAIHRDPDIYPEPDVFDPERFSEENEKARHPMNYLAFGDGPHNCIGLRFANYQTKIGIATLINKFRVDVCDKTCIPYLVNPRSFIPAPIGGIHLKITKLVIFY